MSIFDKIRSPKLIECMENIFTILYFSSYVITPQALRLSHPRNCNITMLGLIEDIIRGNEERVVCVVRISASSIFGKLLRQLRQQAIDTLTRAHCYVKLYDKSQFVNACLNDTSIDRPSASRALSASPRNSTSTRSCVSLSRPVPVLTSITSPPFSSPSQNSIPPRRGGTRHPRVTP